MSYQITPLFSLRAEHGEGPVWDPVHQMFYWVDLMQGQYFAGDWNSGVVETHVVGQPLGVLALREKGGLVMALRDGFFFYDPVSRQLEMIAPTEKEVATTRFNDGAVDPKGRFLAATMTYEGTEPIGNLYVVDTDLSVKRIEKDILLANGMGWSPDRKTYYFTDTFRHVIYAYDCELESGAIRNRRPFITFDDQGFPDGMTVDADGGLWVAMWGKGVISRFDEQGKWIEDIPVPATHPTSCCFGGPDLKHLLITSSQLPLNAEQKKQEPMAGRCMFIETDVVGQEEPRFKG